MCNTPKVPKPATVIERQPYKSAPSRESLASGNPDVRRRVAGVETSAQGVTEAASTTRRVMAGGDQRLLPNIGGAGGTGAPGAMPTPVSATPLPVSTGRTARARAVFGAPRLQRVGAKQMAAY